jgi:hypothetical protein
MTSGASGHLQKGKRSHRKTPVAAVCCLLSACATAAQQEIQRQNTILNDMKPSLDACSKAINDDPSYDQLRMKMRIGNEDASLQMLADKSKTTPQEIALLYKLYGAYQGCRKIILEAAAKAAPMRQVALIEIFTASDKIWADHVSGKTTWGEFNQARDAAKAAGAEKLQEAEAKINAGLQQSHQAEMAQRQRAADAMSAWSAQQQAIQAANRPRTTNCNVMGNTVDCTTY